MSLAKSSATRPVQTSSNCSRHKPAMVRMLVTRPEPDASETAGKLSALGIEPVVEPLLRYETLADQPAGSGRVCRYGPDQHQCLARPRRIAARIDAYRAPQGLCRRRPHRGRRTSRWALPTSSAPAATSTTSSTCSPTRGLAAARCSIRPPASAPAIWARRWRATASWSITTEIYAHGAGAPLSEPVRSCGSRRGDIDAALFYSRRTAEAFVDAQRRASPRARQLSMLCLSEAVAAPLLKAHFGRVSLAEYPSEEAMLGLALSFARDQKRGMIGQ